MARRIRWRRSLQIAGILFILVATVRLSVTARPAEPSLPEGLLERARVVHRCADAVPAPAAPVELDGGLGEWRESFASMERRGGESFDDRDLSAQFAIRWEPAALYIAVEVEDDRHVPGVIAADLWKTDSVQLALDMERDGGVGYGVDDYEMGWGRGRDATTLSYRWQAPAEAGPMQARAAIVTEGRTTRYEIAIPATDLGYDRFPEGLEIGFGIIVNDHDGKGRSSWLEWTSGIGLRKEPAAFDRLCLLPPRT